MEERREVHTRAARRHTSSLPTCPHVSTASVAVGAHSALPWLEHRSGAPVSCLSQTGLSQERLPPERCVKTNVELIRATSAQNLTCGDSRKKIKTVRFFFFCSFFLQTAVHVAGIVLDMLGFECCWPPSHSNIHVAIIVLDVLGSLLLATGTVRARSSSWCVLDLVRSVFLCLVRLERQ